jgi:AbrB family looped-hinge helix DNA binding protein
MDYQCKVNRRGQITLPKKILNRYSMRDGDRVTYLDLGDHIAILPKTRNAVKTLLSLKVKTRDSVQKIKRNMYIYRA